MSVLYFLLLVGVLVVIHELGHYVAAKLLDVKVLRFSLGYGRPLWRKQLGETEYQIAIFPIGGYVRILGIEGESENIGRSFASRPLWQRLIVVFAGPAANLVLPVVIYFVFFVGHTQLPAAVIGDVLDSGPAARAGLEAGDRVLEVDGRAIRYWEELETAVRAAPGKELHLRISRNNKVFERYLTPLEEVVRKRDGGAERQGRVGITHVPFVPIVGVIDESSNAWLQGLRTRDLIVSIDGAPMRNWSDVQGHLGRPGSVTYLRGTEMPGIPQIQLLAAAQINLTPATLTPDPTKPQKHATYTGIERAEMFVARVDPGSPADGAGLKPGDLITALDDKPVQHWMDLDQRLQAEPDHTFKIAWKRAAGGGIAEMSADMTQVERAQLDEYDHTISRLVFGAYDDIDRGTGAMVAIDGRFGYAMSKAFQRTGETISAMVSGFFQIIGGERPGDGLGGPMMMYRVASVSGNQGWDSFLLMIALISVNLGLINLLPIPMLDGGHLLVFAIEGVRRKKLSPKEHGRVQLAGLILVALITVLAIRNDVLRYFFR